MIFKGKLFCIDSIVKLNLKLLAWRSVRISTGRINLMLIVACSKIFKKGKISIKFSNSSLIQEKLTFTKKINLYLVYELDNWPTNPSNNFAIKIVFLVLN